MSFMDASVSEVYPMKNCSWLWKNPMWSGIKTLSIDNMRKVMPNKYRIPEIRYFPVRSIQMPAYLTIWKGFPFIRTFFNCASDMYDWAILVGFPSLFRTLLKRSSSGRVVLGIMHMLSYMWDANSFNMSALVSLSNTLRACSS